MPSVRHLRLPLLAFALLPALACSARLELVPVHPDGGGAASAFGPGLELRADATARARSWSSPSDLQALHIRVSNTGPTPVYVRLGDIELRARRWSGRALPPAGIQPRRRVASLGMDPASPFIALQSPGALGSTRYGRTETVVLEPSPGTRFPALDRGAAEHELATTAFSEGVIASGQVREGFVYFPRAPYDTRELSLRVGVRPDANSRDASVIEIAYVLQG
jgi:hypothetical protein